MGSSGPTALLVISKVISMARLPKIKSNVFTSPPLLAISFTKINRYPNTITTKSTNIISNMEALSLLDLFLAGNNKNPKEKAKIIWRDLFALLIIKFQILLYKDEI